MGIVSSIASASSVVSIGDSVMSLGSATSAVLSPLFDTSIKGIDGLVFDIPESESLSLKAQITDHYIEDNTTLQNHISIAPISITLSGKIAEVVMEQSSGALFAATVLTSLQSLSTIAPELSQSAAKAVKQALLIKVALDQTLSKIRNAAAMFEDKAISNKQKKYYQQIKSMFDSRGIFTVETPWVTLKNMAIESVNFEQDETTKDWSTVSVTLKEMKFAQTKTTTGKLKGRIVMQKESVTDKGSATGNKSILKNIAAAGNKTYGG